MPEILIVIPVLGRPHRARAVYESALEATDVPHRVLFVTSPGDRKQRHACEQTGADVLEVPWRPGRGDWAMKINYAYRKSAGENAERWILLGADDLRFREGWGSAAISLGYIAEASVVGTSDGGGNPRVRAGNHSTHPLVRRSYADEFGTVDTPGEILHEGYDHQYADDELVETAKARGKWQFAPGAVIEHLHPYFGKGEMDSTYRKALRATRADRALFQQRRRLLA